MKTVPLIYKSSQRQKDYYRNIINPIIDTVYKIETKEQSYDKGIAVINNSASYFKEVKIPSAFWGELNQDLIHGVIESISLHTGSKDEVIKNCCVTNNRKLYFPLGYPSSYYLNALVIKLAVLNNYKYFELPAHVENNTWIFIEHVSIDDLAATLFPKSPRILKDFGLIKKINLSNRDLISFGAHTVGGASNYIVPIRVSGVDTFNKFYKLALAMYKYLYMVSIIKENIRTNSFGYQYPISYLQAHEVHKDFLEAVAFNPYMRLVNYMINYIKNNEENLSL